MAIGKSEPMLDAVARVTGTLPYAANLRLPNMLVGRVFRSTVPHARITRLDVTAAEQLPGVAAVVTADDFAGQGRPNLEFGSSVRDQAIVAGNRIRYVGEPVALIAAETPEIAAQAMALIELEYEELPAVFEAEAALASGSPRLHEAMADNCLAHSRLRHGDLEAGFAAADEVVEEVFTSPVAQQVALEQQVAIAQWHSGKLTVWTGTQSPFTVRQVLAAIFGLELGDVRVIVPPLGGGFGAKGNVRTQPMAAALAWKVGGRPVKLVLSRAEEFVTVTKHAAKIIIKSGVRRDGTLTARKVTVFWNIGANASSSAHLVPAGMLRVIGPYRIPAVHVDAYGVYTNTPPAAAYRGAMSSQGTFAYESHMDTIAQRLGMDPLEIRLKNLLRSGDAFATGEVMHDAHFAECLKAAADGLGWSSEPMPASDGPVRRGRGLAVMNKHTIANSASECRLTLTAAGRLFVYTSTVEMGQGAHTALAQIASHGLGVPMEAISVVGPDTDETPPDNQTAASRSTYMMGNAVLKAAEGLKLKLREAASRVLERPPEELAAHDQIVFAPDNPQEQLSYADVLRRNQLDALSALGRFETQVGQLDPETGQGVSSPHWHQGAGACEVAVDTETGKVTVLRYHSASYAGRVVNPALAGLQNDGNVIFGLGSALFEEIVMDHGQITNPNLSDYLIPSFRDIPVELTNQLLEAEASDFHGIGEMTLPPAAPAVANAIYDAVGVRIRDLPLTPERVLRAIRNHEANRG
jgi:CO/xanthine dehydrogenase Mo-binding subunit